MKIYSNPWIRFLCFILFVNSTIYSQSKNTHNMNQEKVIMIVTAQINPNEKEALDEYLKKSGPIFKNAGGKPVNKYKIANQIVGENSIDLVSIMEFPGNEILEAVFEGDEYQALLPLREKGFLKLEVYVSKIH